MKESVTKFDLEAAFKALDDIETPVAEKGIKANTPALTEIFSRKSKFDALFEEYYDIGNTEELTDAKEAREAEVAKAKLARIEKIVDLDAESPDDLLTSYVGKFIIQCPQCMTLFYKNPEDVEESEDDPTTVNVNEVCQHCGNESGYTLIGKVGEATPEETTETEETFADEETLTAEESTEDIDISDEGSADVDVEDFDLDSELEELDLEIEDDEADEEKKEESFAAHAGETLVEDIQEDKELDSKLEAHNEYIEYLRATIAQEEVALEKTDNEQVKAAIQRRIDAFKADLESALPDEVKNNLTTAEEAAEEISVEAEEEVAIEEALTESLKEEADLDISESEFEELINSPEFKKPISDRAVRVMIDTEDSDAKNKKESLEEATLSAKKKDLEHELVFNATGDVKDEDLTNTLCDIISRIKVKYHSAKKLAGKYYITIVGQPEDLQKAKIEIENCGFFKAWLDKNKLTASHSGDEVVAKPLEEGILDKLKDKLSKAIDNLTSSLKSREAKADWIRENAKEDYDSVKVSTEGKLVPDEKNQRFSTFIVIGFADKYSNGKPITMAPSFSAVKDLVIGKEGIQFKKDYKNAERIAKGWSMQQDKGPAFIYLAKDEDDDKAVFLCEYFNGELEYDQLEKYFEVVKRDLKGCKLMNKGGMNRGSDTDEADSEDRTTADSGFSTEDYEEISVADIKPGMRIEDTNYILDINGKDVGFYGEVTKCVKKGDKVGIVIRFDEDNKERGFAFKPDDALLVKLEESLDVIMHDVENLQEHSLEKLISNSLIEHFEHIAGFRLKECAYLNKNFTVNGKILFTSGKTEDTTYTISEAYIKRNGTITLCGLNEKLDPNSRFIITGKTLDEDKKTFITESFKHTTR